MACFFDLTSDIIPIIMIIMEHLDSLIRLDAEEPDPLQMAVRAVIVFFTALVFIKIAGLRMLGKRSAFDTLTSLMLGAIMGRAVVAGQSFIGAMLAAFVIMLLHRFVAWLTFHNKKMGALLKGESLLLMKDGVKEEKNLENSHITEEDIMGALRHDVHISSLDKIKEVYLERSGEISIVKE